MDSSSIGIIVALVLLVIVSAYFSATETCTSLSCNSINLINENYTRGVLLGILKKVSYS